MDFEKDVTSHINLVQDFQGDRLLEWKNTPLGMCLNLLTLSKVPPGRLSEQCPSPRFSVYKTLYPEPEVQEAPPQFFHWLRPGPFLRDRQRVLYEAFWNLPYPPHTNMIYKFVNVWIWSLVKGVFCPATYNHHRPVKIVNTTLVHHSAAQMGLFLGDLSGQHPNP